MAKKTRWVKCHMKCPEKKGEADLVIEWHSEGDKEVLNSIHCNNTKLVDLSGEDCQWTCWGKALNSNR